MLALAVWTPIPRRNTAEDVPRTGHPGRLSTKSLVLDSL